MKPLIHSLVDPLYYVGHYHAFLLVSHQIIVLSLFANALGNWKTERSSESGGARSNVDLILQNGVAYSNFTEYYY